MFFSPPVFPLEFTGIVFAAPVLQLDFSAKGGHNLPSSFFCSELTIAHLFRRYSELRRKVLYLDIPPASGHPEKL